MEENRDTAPVRVVEYNPEWPAMFEAEKRLLENAFGDNVVAIYHIGSTSVPGLAAKPIVDIMPVVRDIERLDMCNDAMAKLGYEAWANSASTAGGFSSKAAISGAIMCTRFSSTARCTFYGIWRSGIISGATPACARRMSR